MKISRRSFLKTATAIGASLAWVGPARGPRVNWHERRDLYPHGVASGDPDAHSVILCTRHPFAQGAQATRQLLTVEVAEDEAFRRVTAHAQAPVSSATDWTHHDYHLQAATLISVLFWPAVSSLGLSLLAAPISDLWQSPLCSPVLSLSS